MKLLEILRSYYKAYRPKVYLFEGANGGRYSNRSAMQVLKRAANKRVNIQYLQEILGHSSPKTTMLYTHLSGKDISNITPRKNIRIMCFFDERNLITLINCFAKKTQKTPRKEIKMAEKLKKEYYN